MYIPAIGVGTCPHCIDRLRDNGGHRESTGNPRSSLRQTQRDDHPPAVRPGGRTLRSRSRGYPLATSAAPAGAARPLRPQAEGEVRFLIAEAFWADWHQYLSTAQSQRRLGQQIFDSLIQIESDDFSAFTPGLAESWEQIDETTWQFVLRQGVTFHNGQPFSAADVKASIELATGATAEEIVTASRFVPTTVEIVDDFTVRLKTATPFAPMLNELARLPILSAADIQPRRIRRRRRPGIETLKASPNGTGPFRLVDDQQNVKTMEANPDYWGGAPAIGTLVWEYIQDGQTRLNAFLAGQAQAIDRVPPEHLPGDRRNRWTVADLGHRFRKRQSLDAPGLPRRRGTREPEAARGGCLGDRPPGAGRQPRRRGQRGRHQPHPERRRLRDAAGAAYTTRSRSGHKRRLPRPDLPTANVELAALGRDRVPAARRGGLPRRLPTVCDRSVSRATADHRHRGGSSTVSSVADKPGLFFHVSWSSNGDPHGALATLYKSPGAWAGSTTRRSTV